MQTWHDDAPVHPVEALTCRHQRIRWIKRHVLYAPVEPAQMRMVSMGKLLALLDHLLRKVYRIKPLNVFYKVTSNIANATADIEDIPGFLVNELSQDSKGFRRIGSAKMICLYYVLILKCLCISPVLRRNMFGFLSHLWIKPLLLYLLISKLYRKSKTRGHARGLSPTLMMSLFKRISEPW